MNHQNSNGSSFDERTADYLADWGQKLSRRGWLARLGHLAIRISGVTLLPLLPVDRAAGQVVPPSCGDWRMCGLWGNVCQSCCGQSAAWYSCPSCTTQGANAWSLCCIDNEVCPPTVRNVSYYDCCGGASANGCTGQGCPNNPNPQGNWCAGTGGTYKCTVVWVGANC